MRRLLLLASLLILIGLPACRTREETTSGIADQNGILTGNKRPVPKKERLTLQQLGEQAVGIVPDW